MTDYADLIARDSAGEHVFLSEAMEAVRALTAERDRLQEELAGVRLRLKPYEEREALIRRHFDPSVSVIIPATGATHD